MTARLPKTPATACPETLRWASRVVERERVRQIAELQSRVHAGKMSHAVAAGAKADLALELRDTFDRVAARLSKRRRSRGP